MLRATREFIRHRQPHTDFVVGTVTVLPDPRPEHRHEIMDLVRDRVREDQNRQAIMGWRVHDYNSLTDETWFEPWWWYRDAGGQCWDIDPDAGVREYIMDQAQVVYRSEAFLAGRPCRPADLYLRQGRWQLRTGDQRRDIDQLDRRAFMSLDRTNTVQFTVLATNR